MSRHWVMQWRHSDYKALLLSSECSYLKETDAKITRAGGGGHKSGGVIWEMHLGTRSPQQHPTHPGLEVASGPNQEGDAETES